MSMASWMIRNINLRSNKSKRSLEKSSYAVEIDPKKDYIHLNNLVNHDHNLNDEIIKSINILDPQENLINIFTILINHNVSAIPEPQLVNCFNAYVNLVQRIDYKYDELNFDKEDLLVCLRFGCVHDSTLVRSAAIRAIRYTTKTVEDVLLINKLRLSCLFTRSLDLLSYNDMERIQSMKLIRRILLIAPQYLEPILARSLISLTTVNFSLAIDGNNPDEKDRMLRACLAVLCELALLNSELFVSVGGVLSITRNLLECQIPRIVEALCGTLLYLLNHPYTRNMAAIDLQCLAAPYCDFQYRKRSVLAQTQSLKNSENIDDRDFRFNCSRLALLSLLRSWPGIFHFCNPTNTTYLKAIVDSLHLEYLEVKNAVLNLLYELLNLPQPDWTDEFSVALKAIDPCDAQDSWRLREGFIVAEAKALLPHLARYTVNITEIHLAMMLYVFIEVGLLNVLADIIVNGDTFICVRATILLGEMLHLIHQLLPPDCYDISPSLPNLLIHATKQHQALTAVTALKNLHKMLEKRPASYSVFLDHILTSSNYFKTNTIDKVSTIENTNQKSTFAKSIFHQLITRNNEDLLKDSGVLIHKDSYSWNWNIIRTILKRNIENCQKLDDSNQKAFFKRLIHYFKPSNNRFSHMDLVSVHAQLFTLVGCDLIKYLVLINDVESTKLLVELFEDIALQINAITEFKSPHDCLFSPHHMSNTCCQKYFLFIGHMTHSPNGIDVLTKTGIYNQLIEIATKTNHTCYVKLIISSLDYSAAGGYSRKILIETLESSQKDSRLYATQFLLVLVRVKLCYFEQWGIELLVKQLQDSNKTIVTTALNILHEACEEKVYLDKLVDLRPDLIKFGNKGRLLLIRFLSTSHGFSYLKSIDFIGNEIDKWAKDFNFRYVRIIEEEIHDSLTLHQRNEDGRYDTRINSLKTTFRKDVYVPPHLYGQLVQHYTGFKMLLQLGNLNDLFKCLKDPEIGSDLKIMNVKAALWACGHLASHGRGVDYLIMHNIYSSIVKIATTNPVYALRGTAIYVLGLMGTTHKGANELFKLGWFCTRHDRHDRWPVIESENWNEIINQEIKHDADSVDGTVKERKLSFSVKQKIRTFHEEESLISIPSVHNSSTIDKKETGLSPTINDLVDIEKNIKNISNLEKPKKCITEKSLRDEKTSNNNNYYHKRSLSESKTPSESQDLNLITSHYVTTTTSILSQPIIAATSSVISFGSSAGSTLTGGGVPSTQTKPRNLSESSTSGISSCDSMVTKYTATNEKQERVQTLSPIPSSSSLNTLKPTFRTPFPRSDIVKQLSLQNTISNIDSNDRNRQASTKKFTHQDLLGYAKWRSLRLNKKSNIEHILSPISTSPSHYHDGIINPRQSSSSMLTKSSSFTLKFLKVRSLERQKDQYSTLSDRKLENSLTPILAESSSKRVEAVQHRRRSNTTSSLARLSKKLNSFSNQLNGNDNQCYMGISMPRRLLDLFSNDKINYTVSFDIIDLIRRKHQDTLGSGNSLEDTFTTSSTSLQTTTTTPSQSLNLTSTNAISDLTIHDCFSCLKCSENIDKLIKLPNDLIRSPLNHSHQHPPIQSCDELPTKFPMTKIENYEGGDAKKSLLDNNILNISINRTMNENLVKSHNNYVKIEDSYRLIDWFAKNSTNSFVDDTNNPAISNSFNDVLDEEDEEKSNASHSESCSYDTKESLLKIDILKNIEKLSNPILAKHARQKLIIYKQKHPNAFQDICLYSEACNIFSNISIRKFSRKYVQELFQDINFVSLYMVRPKQILEKKQQLLNEKLKSLASNSVFQTDQENHRLEINKSSENNKYKKPINSENKTIRFNQFNDNKNDSVLNESINKIITKATIERQRVDDDIDVVDMPIKVPTDISGKFKTLECVKEESIKASGSVELLDEKPKVEKINNIDKSILKINEIDLRDDKYVALNKYRITRSTSSDDNKYKPRPRVDQLCLTSCINKFPIKPRDSADQSFGYNRTRSYSGSILNRTHTTFNTISLKTSDSDIKDFKSHKPS